MTDTLSKVARSFRMSLVRGKNTKPELVVRKIVCKLGYRYRLHASRLPGRPDLSFAHRRRVIFVHGCFWHKHPRCHRLPKSRLGFWLPKLQANRRRDLRNQRSLKKMGWRYLVIWECELRNPNLNLRIAKFLENA